MYKGLKIFTRPNAVIEEGEDGEAKQQEMRRMSQEEGSRREMEIRPKFGAN